MHTSLRRSALGAVAFFAVACGSASNDGTNATEDPAAGKPAPAAENADPRTDDELPTTAFCASSTENPARMRFAAFAPEPRAEYLALRQNQGTLPSPGLTKDLVTVAERGQLCAGAADAAKCKAAYEKLSPEIRLGYQLCFTRGDTVGCVESRAQAAAFLGSVKSIEEAFWLAEYDGYYGQCTYQEVVARGKKLADGSFQLAAMKGGGCADIFRAVINVKPDGTITEREAKKTDLELGCP